MFLAFANGGVTLPRDWRRAAARDRGQRIERGGAARAELPWRILGRDLDAFVCRFVGCSVVPARRVGCWQHACRHGDGESWWGGCGVGSGSARAARVAYGAWVHKLGR